MMIDEYARVCECAAKRQAQGEFVSLQCEWIELRCEPPTDLANNAVDQQYQ